MKVFPRMLEGLTLSQEMEDVHYGDEDDMDEEGEDEDDNVCISSTPLMFFRLLSAQYTRFWWRIYP